MLYLSLVLSLLFTAPTARAAEDPFLWLEEIESPRSLEWVNRQNTRTLERIQSHPLYAPIEREMAEILGSNARLPSISLLAGKVVTFWQDKANPRGLWQRTSLESYKSGAPTWEILLDLDALNRAEEKNWVWKGASCLQPEGRRCLVFLSPGGTDAAEVREFDTTTKAFVAGGFGLPVGKHQLSWIDEETLYVGTDFGAGSVSESGYPVVLKRWKRGTALSEAAEIFRGATKDVLATPEVFHQPGWQPEILVLYVTAFETESYLVDGGKLLRLPLPKSATLEAVLGSRAFFSLKAPLKAGGRELPAGSLVAYPLLRASEGAASLDGLELVFAPSSRRFLSSVVRSGNALILNVLDNVREKMLLARRFGPGWGFEELPLGDNGVAGASRGEPFSDAFLASYMDFLTPASQYLGSSDTGKLELLRSSPHFFDSSGLVTAQLEAKSKDGTLVPYFLVHRKGLQKTGNSPTLLYGYGGFALPMKPWYSATTGKAWLERGGVYVLANIRGGSELGPAWHEAAKKENRQRAFDDFIAIAEDLIERGITSPAHLGIQGGSNGGLLVGAAFTQRPELFRAVLCEVPLLDMLRYHLLLAGASWVGEYGDPSDPAMRAVIEKYSPYQNLRPGVSYPEVFFLTSTRDDRVHPGHARKMAALMESMGHGFLFHENTEGGHGGASTPEQRARMLALEYSYLWMKLKGE